MWWGIWSDYPKTVVAGKEYAKIGNRLYTKHAVDYFQPSGRRTVGGVPRAPKEGGGSLTQGRSLFPSAVESVILFGTRRFEIRGGVLRTVHSADGLEVVTEGNGAVVVTLRYEHGD